MFFPIKIDTIALSNFYIKLPECRLEKNIKLSKMSFNNNKGENDFPYEIKVVEGEVREQFIKDFHGQ